MQTAAIQMTSGPDKRANLARAHELLIEAVDKGAQFVAFPENFSLMTEDTREFLEGAETPKGVVLETLREWAIEYEQWILAGSIAIKAPSKKGAPGKVTNTSFLISNDGEIHARYDKIHLFDADVSGDRKYKESKHVQAGKKPVVGETPFGMVGLSVCYDLRFPELYRAESEAGANVLFIPSAFTVPTGRAHWDVLTRARAIENQCYVVCPAQWGNHPGGRRTYGFTRIIDPWGRVIAERPAGEGVVMARLSLQVIEQVRRDLPALLSRRL